MRALALLLLLAPTLAAAEAEPLVVLVESHAGPRPGRADEYLAAVKVGLGAPAPVGGAKLDALVAERMSSPAGEVGYPLLQAVRGQVLDAQEDITRAQFASGVARIERVLKLVHEYPAAVAADPRIRRVLFEGRLAQLKGLLRLRRQGEAESVAIELGRSFPDFAVVEREHGPEVTEYFTKVRRQSWPKGRASLAVETATPGASVFLNERYVGLSPVKLADVLPGKYRVMARLGEAQSRVHEVNLLEESVELRIDVAFDQALHAGGFEFASDAERVRREPVYALRLARALGAAQVITVGLAGTPERPQLAATVYNVATGTVLRQAAVALAPSPPPPALVVALGRFLRGGGPADGLIVQSDAPDVRGAALPPLPAADSGPGPRPALFWSAIGGYVLALGAAGAGGYLVYLDGRGTCGAARCPEHYHTLGGGVGAIVGAAAVAGVATWLMVRSFRRPRAVVSLAPQPGGALLGLVGRF